jgi:peptidoglycan hydrolase-like protein with peptidoglycan-binding domain
MNKTALFLFCAIAFGTVSLYAADIRDVQTELKSQGFYYGEIDGKSGGETAAAIKRYQIRNGLEVTGTADKETLEALGIGGGSAGSAAPKSSRPTTPPPPAASTTPPASRPPTHLRREDPVQESDREFLERESGAESESYDDPSVVRPPTPLRPPANPGTESYAELFERTPYEIAPLEVQQSTLRRVQSQLAREGYYRDLVDGVPGPATEEAILAFQRRARLPLTGQLDLRTLAAMRLLPGRGGAPMQPFKVPRGGQRSYRGVWID